MLSVRCFDAVNLARCAFNNTNESVELVNNKQVANSRQKKNLKLET